MAYQKDYPAIFGFENSDEGRARARAQQYAAQQNIGVGCTPAQQFSVYSDEERRRWVVEQGIKVGFYTLSEDMVARFEGFCLRMDAFVRTGSFDDKGSPR